MLMKVIDYQKNEISSLKAEVKGHKKEVSLFKK